MPEKEKPAKTEEKAPPGAPQDLSAVKTNTVSRLIGLAGDILALVKRCDEASASYFANGFDGSGASPITQNDIIGTNSHMTPTLVANIITAAQAISTAASSGTRDNLRKTQSTPEF